MNLSKELAKQAKAHDICGDWLEKLMRTTDKKALLEMYLEGIDFCLACDYPTNDFIRANFKGFMEEFGVFLDDFIDLKNPKKCVALGKTQGTVEINSFGVSEIFVKHNSELTVIAKDNAFVMIDVFDNSVLDVLANGFAKVCVNRYGDAKVHSGDYGDNVGVVKIIEKHRKTY